MVWIVLWPVIGQTGENKMEFKANRAGIITSLLATNGESSRFRIERGTEQVASLWMEQDGDSTAFTEFCLANFVNDPGELEMVFGRIQTALEALYGNYAKMSLELRRPLELDMGEIKSIDLMVGEYNPSAHLMEDLFRNHVAFYILLNFPHYSLQEKIAQCGRWSRQEWAYARLGDMITSRIPAELNQKLLAVMTQADTYISEYNIRMGHLVDDQMKTYFPEDLNLITHWGLRDELKSRYADPVGLKKQHLIYQVMQRIITQEIPLTVINNPNLEWNPYTNKVYQHNQVIPAPDEDNRRYHHMISIFRVMREMDAYYPNFPTYIQRKFEMEREIPEKEVESLFIDLISSPECKKVGHLISHRLNRPLQPFDIWYNGFKTQSGITEEELDKAVTAKYPRSEAFRGDIPTILTQLSFSSEQSAFIGSQIAVDASRGAGHAVGAEMKSDKAHLRTRISPAGMNYKGYSIATHELGHCVEQTLTLHPMDYYMLKGVPSNGFTEAFAFVFQKRDLQLLGMESSTALSQTDNRKDLMSLDVFWATYEIMGVSLVDMKVWNWLYRNPEADPAELKQAVIKIAKDVWNDYYAPVFGSRDQIILAVYSHMIDYALYLADYPLGHLIQFQIETYIENKAIGPEMERMCKSGRILPQEWMKSAVGTEISIQPLLNSVDGALKRIK